MLAQCSLSALSQAVSPVFIPIPSDGGNAFYQVSRMKADDWSTFQSWEINSCLCLIHREDLRKHSDWLSVSCVSNLGPMCQQVGGRGCHLLLLLFPGTQVENLSSLPHRDAWSGDNTLANGWKSWMCVVEQCFWTLWRCIALIGWMKS